MHVTYYAHRAVNLDQYNLHFLGYMRETGNNYPPENNREKPLVQFYFDWCEGDARGQWPDDLGSVCEQDISVGITEADAADSDGATAAEVLDALNIRLVQLRSRQTIPGMNMLQRVLLRQNYQRAVDSLTAAMTAGVPS